ncbi:MAG: DASH family cryptochrome [Halobacteria archaeon]|nr:DASH family cryptochrome [Halobacteria archaeon]
MPSTSVVWFRDDLRVHDNPTLTKAANQTDEVVPVYCFDPRDYSDVELRGFEFDKVGPRRADFVRESVLDLRSSLRELGGDLVVAHEKPENFVPRLADEFDADVYHQTKPATEEWNVEGRVEREVEDKGLSTRSFWTHTLYHINDLPNSVHGTHDTFTPWRKEVENTPSVDVRDTFEEVGSVTTPDFDAHDFDVGTRPPSLEELGSETPEGDDRAVLGFEGGESRALERLDTYFWERDRLRRYKETRNGLLGSDYSSKLSAWLSRGCLSPRRVYEEVKEYEEERVANDSTYWLVFELLWRDYFQFQFVKHRDGFFHANGIRNVDKDWSYEDERFDRWRRGETGVPFVDANMRELNTTGYMSNRGRQNVASFLADVLGVDWRLGAAHFEANLVDYDVCSNWGNWAYQAGVGNDSRDRYFNVLKQAERYDPEGRYVRTWIPELAEVPDDTVHTPWKSSEGRQVIRDEYVERVVDVEAVYGSMG